MRLSPLSDRNEERMSSTTVKKHVKLAAQIRCYVYSEQVIEVLPSLTEDEITELAIRNFYDGKASFSFDPDDVEVPFFVKDIGRQIEDEIELSSIDEVCDEAASW
jgi:hypothetical protein